LKILKENPIKSIRIKAHLDISNMYSLGLEMLINTNKFISKGLLKIRFKLDYSKVHNSIRQPSFIPYKQFGVKFNIKI
jgi:hypothetical protein